MVKMFLAGLVFFGVFFSLFKLAEIKIPEESRTGLTKHVIYSILCAGLTVLVLSFIVVPANFNALMMK